MTENMDISARLAELAALAEKEDWLYQAELRLAGNRPAITVF